MIIVGVDPGLTTGLCSVDGDKLRDGIELTYLWDIYRWIRNAGPDQIVMEDFHGGHKGDYKHPLKVMGAVELFAVKVAFDLDYLVGGAAEADVTQFCLGVNVHYYFLTRNQLHTGPVF